MSQKPPPAPTRKPAMTNGQCGQLQRVGHPEGVKGARGIAPFKPPCENQTSTHPGVTDCQSGIGETLRPVSECSLAEVALPLCRLLTAQIPYRSPEWWSRNPCRSRPPEWKARWSPGRSSARSPRRRTWRRTAWRQYRSCAPCLGLPWR